MCDADSVKTVSQDSDSPKTITPPSSPSAPNGGYPPAKLKRQKPRSPDKVISTLLHYERKNIADIESMYSRQRFQSLAFINFITTLQVSTHLPLVKSPVQVKALFDSMYQSGQLISLAQIQSLDATRFDWDETAFIRPYTGINFDLFPLATPHFIEKEMEGKMEPQSGFLPPSSPIFEECQSAVNAALDEYVAKHPQLLPLLTVPSYALLLGSAFCMFVFYRLCRDILLSVKFVLGFLTGFSVQKRVSSNKYSPQSAKQKRNAKRAKAKALKAEDKAVTARDRLRKYEAFKPFASWYGSHTYTPQSGTLDNAKTFSQYLTRFSSVASALVALVTLMVETRKKGNSYAPQSGLGSDDGALFTGTATQSKTKTTNNPKTVRKSPSTGTGPSSLNYGYGQAAFGAPTTVGPKYIPPPKTQTYSMGGFGDGI